MMKKPSVAFPSPPLARRDSLVAHISNGLQPFEMAAQLGPDDSRMGRAQAAEKQRFSAAC